MENTDYHIGTYLIYIDANRNGILSGRFCNPMLGDCEDFRSIAQLMLKIDRHLNDQQMPQAFHSPRRFTADYSGPSGASFLKPPGRKANFIIRIHFRRHASWQGAITWVEAGRTQRFRSVLELMGLLSSILAPDYDSINLDCEA